MQIGKHDNSEAARPVLRCLYAAIVGVVAIGSSSAGAADHIRVATLKTGTLA